ncbi:transporter family-2 protein [Natranaerovirga pectinivora]|uniref:Transporter family-2 protein n=1 Tax=Natranaerovirga pectinivora TaxID=682400 RepID=A0A4R3MMY9_9FIRM|nr:DMT family transporter [Natranaerovirga pectinivora]TCT16355.1 transporter family-2 protein [Natranaerovirga pectinivora]
MIGFIMSIIAGILMSIQGVFNTNVRNVSHMWTANTWVHFTGLIVCVAFWLFTGRDSFGKLFQVDNKLYLTGGIIGAFIIYTVIRGISDLGPCYAIMLILIAQVTVAYLIEVFGLFAVDKVGFEWMKLLGVALMVAGIVVFKWERVN